MLTSLNNRIDGVIKDLTELKSSLQFTQKNVDDLKPVLEQMTKIEKQLGELHGQVDYHSNEMECLENRSPNNTRIDGIPEELNETWDDIECRAKMTLESNFLSRWKLSVPIVQVKVIVGALTW